jgi:hypothetical protein
VTIGSPPQEQTVIVDTGSSDLYFDASFLPNCQKQGLGSCHGGSFNPSKSNTYKEIIPAPAFNQLYGDGTTATGPLAMDTFGIGDVSISDVIFGLATETESKVGYSVGLMGIGYNIGEATSQETGKYPNIPEVLVSAGIINSRLFSVFLNDQRDISGSILFGGIDTSRYSGNLVTLNMLPQYITATGSSPGFLNRYLSVVTAMNATVSGKLHKLTSGGSPDVKAYSDDDAGLPVILDTGAAAWFLDTDIYAKIIAPVFDFVDEKGLCSCAHATSNDFLSLEFGGRVHIKVPASEFIIPAYDIETKEPIAYDAHNQACVFMIQPHEPNGEGMSGLGDAILRSMYVVYDLDNGQISIAQASEDDSAKSNIVPVPAGPLGVARAVSNVVTASPNTWTIPPRITYATSHSVSTLATAIGTATGTNAVPLTARLGSNGGVVATGTPSPSTSPNAAAGRLMPATDFTGLWMTGLAAVFATLGASLIL